MVRKDTQSHLKGDNGIIAQPPHSDPGAKPTTDAHGVRELSTENPTSLRQLVVTVSERFLDL